MMKRNWMKSESGSCLIRITTWCSVKIHLTISGKSAKEFQKNMTGLTETTMHTHRGFLLPKIRKECPMKKLLLALALAASILLCGCSEADKANANISKQADYFESERKITVYNARTDKVILEAEGYMSISNNSNNELVCTVKIGPDTYRKNYIYLNDYTIYVVEDITGTHTDPYHYKLYFHTDILPSVEVKP
nr:MAG TPA: adhesin [Caudoviricetes sp.]